MNPVQNAYAVGEPFVGLRVMDGFAINRKQS